MKLVHIHILLMAIAFWSSANIAAAQQPQPQIPPELIERARALDQILSTHPKEEIRKTLRDWIRTGRVQLNFQLREGKMVMVAMVGAGGKLTPVLVIEARWLVDAAVPLAEKQVSIWESWTYVNQLFSGRYPAEIFFPLLLQPGAIAPPSDVPLYFWSRTEAFESACTLATELGATTYNPPLCKPYETRGLIGLREAYANLLGETPPFSPYKEVLQMLAHLAPTPGGEARGKGKGNGCKSLPPSRRRMDI